MKGILLAGGKGTRLHPLTIGISKQLMPVFDKPMIYYPLSTLILAGAREIAIVTTSEQQASFQKLLGDGAKWGLEFTYLIQDQPNGIAEAYLLAKDFLNGKSSCLALGDNLFYGSGLGRALSNPRNVSGAKVFGFRVSNPQDYGVAVLDEQGIPISLVEKPTKFESDLAIPGLYFFDGSASARAAKLSPSNRGELEITELLSSYLADGNLQVEVLARGTVWLDTGTIESLAEAGDYVRVVQKRQGTLIGSPEEASWRVGLISNEQLQYLAQNQGSSEYGRLLLSLIAV